MNFLFSDCDLHTGASKPAAGRSGGGVDIKKAVLKAEQHLDEMKTLDPYARRCDLVTTLELLQPYLLDCMRSRYVVIDTETTGLNFKRDRIVGFSLKCSNSTYAIYVPVAHLDMYTQGMQAVNLPVDECRQALKCLESFSGEFVFYNSSFDVKMIRQWFGVNLPTGSDVCIMGQLLDENRVSNKLKNVHAEVMGKESTGTFEDIFSSPQAFQYVRPEKAYFYGAKDVLLTEDLFLKFTEELEKPANKGIYHLFHNVEKPLTQVLTDMEWHGVRVDLESVSKVGESLDKGLADAYNEYALAMMPHKLSVAKYIKEHPDSTLEWPPNIQSSTQLVTFFYDISKELSDRAMFDNEGNMVKPVCKRTVEEKVLSLLDSDVAKAVLKYRTLAKLKGTYVDNLSTLTDEDGMIHCSFRQLGARTGRQSCADPNLQNIPSDQGAVIRSLFIPSTPQNVLISCDYSAQEMRILAHLSNDPSMIGAYVKGKDLYSEVASIIFKRPYDECLEFVNGVYNCEGKKRRSAAKTILLGISYGMGIKKLAERLSIPVIEARKLYQTLMGEIPGLEGFMAKCEARVKRDGYVKTIWGRRRRLPDAKQDEYQFKVGKTVYGASYFESAYNRLIRTKFDDKQQVIEELENELDCTIIDNSAKVSKALRQTVNSVVQGSAADLTKMAMVDIAADQELKDLGFTLLLSVHDEVIGECPEDNAKEAGRRLSEIMCDAGADLKVPLKCDVEITHKWGVKESYELFS